MTANALAPREASASRQVHAINAALDRIRAVPGDYGRRLDGVPRIQHLSELAELPLTTREDLEAAGPLGACAVGPERIARVHASSGSRGAPLLVPYTIEDLDLLAALVARGLTAAGVGRGDVFQNAKGYGLFTGGLAFHEAATRIGAMVIPTATGRSVRQIDLLQVLGVTILGALPSYCLRLAEVADANGVDLRTLPVRRLMLGAESLSDPVRAELQERFAAEAYNCYGLAEVIGPGVAAECREHAGMHVWEDHFSPEVIDPDTLAPVADGQTGELVLSAPTKLALPLLRYRTRDMVRWTAEPCGCGRTTARILEVVGRSDDMLTVRGVSVFPSEIERVLVGSRLTGSEWYVETDGRSRYTVWIEARERVSEDSAGLLAHRLQHILREGLGVRLEVSVVSPGTLPREDGKARRVRIRAREPGMTGVTWR